MQELRWHLRWHRASKVPYTRIANTEDMKPAFLFVHGFRIHVRTVCWDDIWDLRNAPRKAFDWCHVKSMCLHARVEMTSEIYVIFPGSHRTTYENFVTGNFNPWECHRGLNCMETYNQWWWCKFAIAFVTNVLSLPARLMWISGFWDDIWMALDQSDPRTGVLSCGIKLAIKSDIKCHNDNRCGSG